LYRESETEGAIKKKNPSAKVTESGALRWKERSEAEKKVRERSRQLLAHIMEMPRKKIWAGFQMGGVGDSSSFASKLNG